MVGLFETYLDVTDLDRSLEFYTGVLGLQLVTQRQVDSGRADAHSIGASRFALLWVGGQGHAMLGLWEFRDFLQRRTTAPMVFGFIPAASIYFDDPDALMCWSCWL